MRLSIFISLFFLAINCYSQCPTNPAFFNWYNTDTLVNDTIECLPSTCEIKATGGWELPSLFKGKLEVGAITDGVYRIFVLSSCDSLRIDTCLYLSESLSFRLLLYHDFGISSQIVVCGNVGAEVILVIEISANYSPLPHTILETDTLCGAVYVDQSIDPCTSMNYIDIIHYSGISEANKDNLKPSIYWQWCDDIRKGKKILVK